MVKHLLLKHIMQRSLCSTNLLQKELFTWKKHKTSCLLGWLLGDYFLTVLIVLVAWLVCLGYRHEFGSVKSNEPIRL